MFASVTLFCCRSFEGQWLQIPRGRSARCQHFGTFCIVQGLGQAARDEKDGSSALNHLRHSALCSTTTAKRLRNRGFNQRTRCKASTRRFKAAVSKACSTCRVAGRGCRSDHHMELWNAKRDCGRDHCAFTNEPRSQQPSLLALQPRVLLFHTLGELLAGRVGLARSSSFFGVVLHDVCELMDRLGRLILRHRLCASLCVFPRLQLLLVQDTRHNALLCYHTTAERKEGERAITDSSHEQWRAPRCKIRGKPLQSWLKTNNTLCTHRFSSWQRRAKAQGCKPLRNSDLHGEAAEALNCTLGSQKDVHSCQGLVSARAPFDQPRKQPLSFRTAQGWDRKDGSPHG